ncbi:hypothetical protein ANO14919_036490 [Xylariales sp. No.14919]|nr:hypothetical protein ANO14919_036490 [Xylariales sp. No.14919]
MHCQAIILFVQLVFAAQAPRTRHATPTSQSPFANTLMTCSGGYQVCEDGCMVAGDTCCNDGTSESCEAGYYCIPNSCCPEGEICNNINDYPCETDELVCGDYCMPITGTCCNDQGYYCPDFGVCTSDGACCDLGYDCESSDSGSGPDSSWTFASPPTSSVSSPTSKDDYTLVSPESTSTDNESSSSTPTSTTETTHAVGGLVFPTAVPSDNDSPSKSTPAPISVTVTPSSNPPIPGQAGGHHTVGSRIIAGFVAIAAFVIQNL